MITKIDRMNGYLGFTRVHGDTRYNKAKTKKTGSHTNVCGSNHCGTEGVNFLHPTNKPKGYYNVLKWIGEFGPVRWSEIKRHFCVIPSMTLARLRDGCLLEHKDHRWSITDLGISYLKGAKLYLKNRK